MDKDKVEELCELTPEQIRSFNVLRRAYKNCLENNIVFHQVLEHLEAYNGNNVTHVDDTDNEGEKDNSPYCTRHLCAPYFSITNAWADDIHFVHLKDKYLEG